MSGLAPAHRSGRGDRNETLRFVGPGMLSPAGLGVHSTRTRILIWDIELTGSAANYTGEPEFCPR